MAGITTAIIAGITGLGTALGATTATGALVAGGAAVAGAGAAVAGTTALTMKGTTKKGAGEASVQTYNAEEEKRKAQAEAEAQNRKRILEFTQTQQTSALGNTSAVNTGKSALLGV